MKEASPQEAHELMKSDAECIYLDVRSVPEFQDGHPFRAINIPLMHLVPGQGMSPNPEFSSVVEANLPKGAKIVVGCKTGGRSARAAEIMTQLGYTDVTNVRGGFGGLFDNTGRLVEPGWAALNLPICRECTDPDYESLAANAKR